MKFLTISELHLLNHQMYWEFWYKFSFKNPLVYSQFQWRKTHNCAMDQSRTYSQWHMAGIRKLLALSMITVFNTNLLRCANLTLLGHLRCQVSKWQELQRKLMVCHNKSWRWQLFTNPSMSTNPCTSIAHYNSYQFINSHKPVIVTKGQTWLCLAPGQWFPCLPWLFTSIGMY